jgi:prepilin-type N-terminal cleavage/methylation domain-containing protein
MRIKDKSQNSGAGAGGGKSQSGFSLIEVIIALSILLVAVLGVFATFTYATIYNGGNSRRSQALSVFQQEIELLRSAKFTPTIMDSTLTGGVKTPKTVTAVDGFSYLVEVTVDDDPFAVGTQTNNAKTLKEITLTVTPQAIRGSWVVKFPTKVVFRRVRAN